MDCIILGAGTAYPDRNKGPSSIWLGHGETQILVDCGSGTCQKLIRAGGDLVALDAILLTHAHPDHLSDLPALLFALRMPGVERTKPLEIVHSGPLTSYLDGLRETFSDWLEPRGFEVRYRPVEPDRIFPLGSLKVLPFEVAHHPTSLGYRLQSPDGVRLAIPSDTGLCQSLVDHVQRVDCLVLECAATEARPLAGHLTPLDVLYVLDHASPFGLVLTHIYPWAQRAGVVDQVRAGANCPVVVAEDGMAIDVRRGGMVTREENLLGWLRDSPSQPVPGSAQVAEGPGGRGGSLSGDDMALMRGLLESELSRLDPATMARLKYDGPPESKEADRRPASRDEWGFERAVKKIPQWTEADLVGLAPNREQKRLLQRAPERSIQTEINLRGSTRDDAMARLQAVVPTWARTGVRLARIVTGKGKQSEDEPVLKLAALNWLAGPDGQRWVKGWAPVITTDGNFGSIIIELRTT